MFVGIQCLKDKSDTDRANPNEAGQSKKDFNDHLVPANQAQQMMVMFDETIGSSIQSKFKTEILDYVSTRMVTYDIDPLIAYLNYLKQEGSTRVHVRFAAINGNGENGQIAGLPYQTLLFYGNRLANYSQRDSSAGGSFFDHGELCPQICE
jgi:hypothetical protein